VLKFKNKFGRLMVNMPAITNFRASMFYFVTLEEQHYTQWTVRIGQEPVWRITPPRAKHRDYCVVCTTPLRPSLVNPEAPCWRRCKKTSERQHSLHLQVCGNRAKLCDIWPEFWKTFPVTV
jgi:hypothetical protein